MKLFDVVNEQDAVIGQASAQDCHANPQLIHRVVHFTLVDVEQAKVLLTFRPANLAFDGGQWCFLGEHVLAGETPEQTIARAFTDELGIEGLEFSKVSDSHIFAYASQRELARFMVGYWSASKQLSPDQKEVSDYKWVTLEELIRYKEKCSQITQYWIEQTDWEKVLGGEKK